MKYLVDEGSAGVSAFTPLRVLISRNVSTSRQTISQISRREILDIELLVSADR